MSPLLSFTVRAYPSFRPARLFRVLLSHEVIYFIQMKGLLSQADAGGTRYASGLQRMMAEFIRWWASRSIANGIADVDRADPEELVRNHKKNLRITPQDFASSTLEPASFLDGSYGYHARWKFKLKDGRKMVFHVEDFADLKAAIADLPEFLGSTHKNKVGWNDATETFFNVS